MSTKLRQRPPEFLVGLFVNALGQEKSLEVILAATRELNMKGPLFSLEQAQQLLDKIAVQKGLIGITARFAKARMILLWSREDS